jgi:clan AA aspartic protease
MMGTVYATITIKNHYDVRDALHGYIKEEGIRQATVKAVVDTGAMSLVINEELCQQLGLEIMGERPASVANGAGVMLKIAGPVELRWKNRTMMIQPYVLSGSKVSLLGVIPLEYMDLIVDPIKQELVGAHGDEVLVMVY